MMKRSFGIHLFICSAFGMAIGCSLVTAIQDANIFRGVECIVITIACVLNIACGHDKGEKK